MSRRWELVRVAWVAEASHLELVRGALIFTVNMPNGSVATSLGKLLAQVIAFSYGNAQMLAVAAPLTGHHHDNQQRVQFEDHAMRRQT